MHSAHRHPQVSLDVHEEAVLPTLLRDRPGLDHTHIDVIENKIAEHAVQRTAAVRQLETEADFLCARLIDAILRQNQETGRIVRTVVDRTCQLLSL